MLAKLFLTAIVVFGAYLVIRKRYRDARGPGDSAAGAADPDAAARRGPPMSGPVPRIIPRQSVHIIAYGLVALMVGGSLLYLARDWRQAREVVKVQVVNPYSGDVQTYEARRGDIDGRSFTTLDGRRIRIADMERLVLDARR